MTVTVKKIKKPEPVRVDNLLLTTSYPSRSSMVLIWSSTLRRCMAKSTIEPPSGFKAFRQGKYCNYLALRVIKDFIFLIYGLWALENRLNHIFRKALLPNYRWRHSSRWLKIFFLQKSSCYISIDSFFCAE